MPCIIGQYDVVVAGGGITGIGAACAAARQGAKTLLVERLEVLGGLGTSGGVGNFCFGDDSLPLGQGSVLSNIWQALHSYNAIGPENGWKNHRQPPFFNHTFDHNILAIVLQNLAESSGVTLLLATDIVGAQVENGVIKSAILHNRSLLQQVAASIFIDATGDGILARHAGAQPLPPDPSHPQSIPPSHMIFVQPSAKPRPQIVKHKEPGAPPPKYSIWPEPDRVALKMWWPNSPFDTSTGQGYSDAGRAFRRRIPEFVHHFQNTEQGRNTTFAYSSAMFGLRDSVRITGDYILTEDDLRAGRRFPDAVAHGCFPLDSSAIAKEPMPPYQIPYRSILAQNTENLLVAGRCFSATRIALSSTRIMVTCCLMGEAAGIAAAAASQKQLTLRNVPPASIRRQLLADSPDDAILHHRLTPPEP